MIIAKYYHRFRSYLKRATRYGFRKDVYLANGVQFLGLDQVSIGSNTTVGEHTLFTVNNREAGGKQMIIGNSVYIGRDNFFTVGKRITIGDYCIFGNKCAFLGADHVFDTPLKPYAATGASYDKEIHIGVNCWLGNAVNVVGNVTIGHGSIVGAGSVVTRDIPPFSIAVGNPARVVKRFDFARGAWVKDPAVGPSEYDDEKAYLDYLTKNHGALAIAYYSSTSKSGDI